MQREDTIEIDRTEALAKIAADIITDEVTPELAVQATQLVFGAGSPTAEVVFIGEAPGKNEDLKGEPFVGAAGKFLNEMLAGIGLDRSDIYITNIVKYRPPANRDPTAEEISSFIPYLERQIEIIQPKLVIFLGRHAMNVFLPELKISEAHGTPVQKGNQTYMPLFHPAAALYNGSLRQTLRDDFAKIPMVLKNLN